MRRSTILRFAFASAALGAAIAANAFTILLASSGTATVSTNDVFTETVYAQVGGAGALGSLVDTFSNTTGLGTAVYTGTGGTLDLSVAFNIHSTQFGGGVSDTGTWTAIGGTGTYTGATGSGTIAATVLTAGGYPYASGTVTAGSIQTAPEPATMAGLGLGAFGLIRRRKSA